MRTYVVRLIHTINPYLQFHSSTLFECTCVIAMSTAAQLLYGNLTLCFGDDFTLAIFFFSRSSSINLLWNALLHLTFYNVMVWSQRAVMLCYLNFVSRSERQLPITKAHTQFEKYSRLHSS